MTSIQNLSQIIANGSKLIPIPGGSLSYHIIRLAFPTPEIGAIASLEYSRVGYSDLFSARTITDGELTGVYEFEIDGDVSNITLSVSGLSEPVYTAIWLQSALQPFGAFNGTRAMVVQPYDSINIKRGLQFELPLLIDPIVQSTSYFILAEIGIKPIIIKTREINTNGGMEYRPWRGAIYTKGALIDRVVNLNGFSATENTTKFYDVSGVSLAGAIDFDIVKSTNDSGTNRQLGQFPQGIERVVPPGATILIEFRNVQSQDIWVTFTTTWYEGPTDILPDEPL